MSWWSDLLIAAVIFLISFFSITSGGIALLGRPILILAGLPPAAALGTFRVANLAGRMAGFSAILQTHTAKMDWKLAGLLFIASLIGGVAGAEMVTMLPADAVKKVLGAFILVMGVLALMKREIGLVERREKVSRAKSWIGFTATTVLGIIAAFVGGVGVLFSYLLIFVYNKTYLSSASVRKLANFGSALSSSILFMVHGTVHWRLMFFILFAGILGEYFGSKYQIRKRADWVRTITLILVFTGGIAMLLL